MGLNRLGKFASAAIQFLPYQVGNDDVIIVVHLCLIGMSM